MKRVLAILAIVLSPFTAQAFTCTTPPGCTFDAVYTEPTKVVTGANLTNLISTTVTYTISVDGGLPGVGKVVTVPASSPTGGGVITKSITDATLLPGHDYVINGSAIATNGTGPSAPSAPFTPLAIGRAGEVPPNPPVGGAFK